MNLCLFCNKEIVNKNNKFCNRSCAASFNNLKRHQEGYTLNGKSKVLNCLDCKVELIVPLNSSNSIRCTDCYLHHINNKEIICAKCNEKFVGAYYREYCNDCLHLIRVEQGRIGGLIRNTIRVKRSKNEIHFVNLCIDYFGIDNVLLNESMFDGWDADVIIKVLKIAVLWNGKWHYEKITEKHSLSQVQNRDKIKKDIIMKYGYIPYIIKDMGSESILFVKDEFDKFVEYSKLV